SRRGRATSASASWSRTWARTWSTTRKRARERRRPGPPVPARTARPGGRGVLGRRRLGAGGVGGQRRARARPRPGGHRGVAVAGGDGADRVPRGGRRAGGPV